MYGTLRNRCSHLSSQYLLLRNFTFMWALYFLQNGEMQISGILSLINLTLELTLSKGWTGSFFHTLAKYSHHVGDCWVRIMKQLFCLLNQLCWIFRDRGIVEHLCDKVFNFGLRQLLSIWWGFSLNLFDPASVKRLCHDRLLRLFKKLLLPLILSTKHLIN